MTPLRTRPRWRQCRSNILTVITGTVLLGVAVLGAAAPADAAPAGGDEPGGVGTVPGAVTVIKVSGLIDPVMASFVEEQIAAADAAGDVAIVLQLNSRGSVVSSGRLDELVGAIARADVPVAVWIGPSGSEARGGAADLAAAADVIGLPAKSKIEVTPALFERAEVAGPGRSIEDDDEDEADDEDGADRDEDAATQVAIGDVVGAGTAVAAGVVDNDAPVIGDFILTLPGVESTQVSPGEREPRTRVRFGQLELVDQLFHTVASPPTAYLLLVVGASLLVFELFTAGVGVAGVVGAGSLVLAAYGLGTLPVNIWALVVLGLAFVGFAIDVQTGVPRFWTGFGVVALVVGSLGLYQRLQPSWITLVAGIGGVVLAMIGGMPAMVRTRFSTPTIGRDWMIGEVGRAVADVSPDGVVSIRDAPWRAHTNRATPIAAGDEVRVVAIEGLVLEVEPLEGAARDYRRSS